ncbi:MAG: LysM peptidoglycan-binding domain-containing protein [Thermoanaerobaculia bacterium]
MRTFLILGCAALFASAVSASDIPPANLHLVQDHWTAWDPPVPPEGARVHIVAPGDTLWGLAAANLGDPYLWPQLWEKNQYIRDAHWIYPGDPILIDLAVTDDSLLAEGDDGSGEGDQYADADAGTGDGNGNGYGYGTDTEGDGSDTGGGLAGLAPAGGKNNPPVPLGTQDDIYCSGFIGDPDLAFGYSIVGSEYEVLSPQLLSPVYGSVEGIFGAVDTVKYRLTAGDIVYVDGGRSAGLSPGNVFTAVAPRQLIRHPLSRDVVGRRYDYFGRVRVLSVQDNSAIAEIVQSCDGITVGMKLRPFEPEPIPLARRTPVRPVNDPAPAETLATAPMIVSASMDNITLGQDHVVFIDRGEADDVYPGDIFTIYRTNRDSLPPVVLGELAVLSVQPHTAVAKIIASRYPVYVGDRLDRK